MTKPIMFSEWLRDYALGGGASPGAKEQLAIIVKQFEAFTKGKAIADITADDVNRWGDSLLGRNKRVTVASKVSKMRTLLKRAYRARLRGRLDGTIRKLKVPQQVVKAFTPEEVKTLLAAAEKVKGYFPLTGLKKNDFLTTFINAAWDTCFRVGDMLSARFTDLRERGDMRCLIKTQNKTGRVVVRRLRDLTWQGIQRLRHQGNPAPDRLIFEFAACRNAFYKMIRFLCQDAGVKGTSKYIRRSRATTDCNLWGVAAAVEILGHADASGGTARKSYLDQSQIIGNLRMPPAIGQEVVEEEVPRTYRRRRFRRNRPTPAPPALPPNGQGEPAARAPATPSGNGNGHLPPASQPTAPGPTLTDADVARIAHQLAATLGRESAHTHANGNGDANGHSNGSAPASGRPETGLLPPLAQTNVAPNVWVTTQFLSAEQRRVTEDRLRWETSIVGGQHNGFQEQHTNREEALAGHARAVAMANEAMTTEEPIPRAILERLPGPSTAQAFVEDDDEPGEDDTALEEHSLRSQTL